MCKKRKYVQITLMYNGAPQGGFVDKVGYLKDFFNDLLRDGDEEDEWKVKIVEMTKSEFDALPEFTGF